MGGGELQSLISGPGLRFRTIINTLVRVGPAILTFGQLILVGPDGSPALCYPSLLPLLLLLLLLSPLLLLQVVYYTFAMVGMELFKGKIQYFAGGSEEPTRFFCGNLLLNGTSFAQLNYCKNNFNDVVSSFILLLELTMVNQWHDILQLPASAGQQGAVRALLLEEELLELEIRV